MRSLEFCGYIYLKHFDDYETSIACYSRALDLHAPGGVQRGSVVSYYNYGQACYNRAEELYYDNSVEAQILYKKAIDALKVVKAQRGRVQGSGRKSIYQDVLFYLAVSYQKLYYLSSLEEYLEQAYYSWIDYMDYFNRELLEDVYFANQYRIAESYREEVKRLRSEK
jgi:hypothetical protein